MNNQLLVEKILRKMQSQLKSKTFRSCYFSEESNAFTRTRKMSLENIVSFLMQRSNQSLDIKLDHWFTAQGLVPLTVSKQAISKARQQIPADLFYDFMRLSAQMFLSENAPKKNWNGYQVYAIDATDIQIPTTAETLADFGAVKTRFNNRLAGASAAILYDVLNDVVLDGVIAPYKTAERQMAKELIEHVEVEKSEPKHVLIFDRGYPSYEFISYLIARGITFVIRNKEQSSRMWDIEKADGILYRKWGEKNCGVRSLRIQLNTGEYEYLLTNIPQRELGIEAFEELYFMRWGIEEKYKEIKSRMQIEAFSGKRSICIKQDFYIGLLLSNLCGLIKNEVDKEIKANTDGKRQYQANKSYLIHQVNREISRLLLTSQGIDEVIKEIIRKCEKKRSQIRRNRKSERNLNINRRKYSSPYKTCL